MKKKNAIEESNYIVGIDLGQSVATVSYLDQKTLKPVMYDLSGGYGDVSIPMLLQYIVAEGEWLIGNDAKMNYFQEGTISLDHLFDLLLAKATIQVADCSFQPSQLVNIFLTKIIESFLQLNPVAKISVVAIAIPDQFYEVIKEQIEEATKVFEEIEVHIHLASYCLLNYLMTKDRALNGKIIVVDYGQSFLNRSILEVSKEQVTIECEEASPSFALKAVEKVFQEELVRIYLKQVNANALTEEEHRHILQTFEQCFMTIFQKYSKKQGAKLYYNFAFPPFQKVLAYERIHELLEPYIQEYACYLKDLISLDPVVFVGQGYKMLWPKACQPEEMKTININAFESVAKGSCLIAASSVLEATTLQVILKKPVVKSYGMMVNGETSEIKLEDEQIFIVDFEEESELKLTFTAQDETSGISVEDEQVIKKENDYENKVRLCIKTTISKQNKAEFVIEYLQM